MEEAKAAALYEDLTRRGEGAAKFKQGLGFSSDAENSPARGSALAYTSSSSFMSKFVKASSPSKTSELEKHAQIHSIQNKLKRKKPEEEEEEKRRRSESRRRSRSRERSSRRRSRSRDRDRDRRRRRSRSPRRSDRRRSRSSSPARERGSEKSRGKSERSGGHDYRKLIQGYDKMFAAERVKAKMKFQLAETSEKDTTKGKEGWERFDFNKDAPLDDEEVEVAEDDAALVNHIGKSFRFSAFENKREERIKAAHDEAMFGASNIQPSVITNSEVEVEDNIKDHKESEPPSLLSEKVLAKKQGSWRDRIRNKN